MNIPDTFAAEDPIPVDQDEEENGSPLPQSPIDDDYPDEDVPIEQSATNLYSQSRVSTSDSNDIDQLADGKESTVSSFYLGNDDE
jgi:hypothetical protein